MLIRSQNKEVLTNLNALAGIEIAEGPVKTVITSYITGCSYLLGEYSNKQKAVKYWICYRKLIQNMKYFGACQQEWEELWPHIAQR